MLIIPMKTGRRNIDKIKMNGTEEGVIIDTRD